MDQTNKNSSTITTPVAQVASVVITPVDINNNDYSVINLNGNQDESGEHTNEGFTNDDVEISDNMNEVNFQRNRPGTTTSIRSTTSTTSRSSVNCTTGIVRCPNLRLTKFFSYKEGGLTKCMTDAQPIILEQIDGSILGHWLLIEIDHWDLHREKLIILTEKSLVTISYDFIVGKLKNYKRIMLADITGINYGNLAYPEKSMMGEYHYGAVKIRWGEDPSFFSRWNPFSNNIPYAIYTSHHIIYNQKEHETSTYNCDDFIQTLELAISKLQVANKVEFKEGPIQVPSYASLISVLYNQNWLGFQLDRNGLNF